jgi:hypothetical protein
VANDSPPAAIPTDHQLTASQFAAWDGPGGRFHKESPRQGRELEWFAVTGRMGRVRAEDDGDLHVQLVDPHATRSAINAIVEIPNGPPWCQIRQQVLGWAAVQLPLSFVRHRELHLTGHPLIRVTGHAFYDANQAARGDTRSNRRRGIGRTTATIWEIHPVMRLDVVE